MRDSILVQAPAPARSVTKVYPALLRQNKLPEIYLPSWLQGEGLSLERLLLMCTYVVEHSAQGFSTAALISKHACIRKWILE